ncbi:MAG TPA: hypothetical protein VND64_32490 [Pirellulales bacterium]|nr:hypothetical protein [Pirellulales bacterium]
MCRFEHDLPGERLRTVLRLSAARSSSFGEPDNAETVKLLHAVGIGDTALRSLLTDCVIERIPTGADPPHRRTALAALADDEWLRLTNIGKDFVQVVYHFLPASAGGGARVPYRNPFYHLEKRNLWYEGDVLKDFNGRRRGPQETVLLAFQELGWPETMDDPLPGKRGRDRAHYLRKVVARLNAGQHGWWRIKFETDKRGQAIRWKVVEHHEFSKAKS